jgi:hypothetical protein
MLRLTKPAWTWAFEEGLLTIDHLGTVISLGRYASRKFAAKAAARYIALHADKNTIKVRDSSKVIKI